MAGLALVAVYLGAFYGALPKMLHAWRQPDYGHVLFVPFFCAYLLWYRREFIPKSLEGNLWAIPLFVCWAILRWVGGYFNFEWIDFFAFAAGIPIILFFVGGWQAMLWAWPAALFLFLIVPLPGIMLSTLSLPLQRTVTRGSVFILQTLSIPSMGKGNTIILPNHAPLEVEQACSGIRNLIMFVAICVGAAFVVKKPAWEKIFIAVSAIPISIFSNMVRITLTALLVEFAVNFPSVKSGLTPILATLSNWLPSVFSSEIDTFFHDFAGLMMIVTAFATLFFELFLLSKLLVSEEIDKAEMVRGTSGGIFSLPAQNSPQTPPRKRP